MVTQTKPVVWITRTPDGAKATARAIEALGCEAVIAPVLKVVQLKPMIDPHSFGALIFTSRNGVAAFCAVCNRRAVAAYCVGDATAEAARARKFRKVISAHGDIDALHALLQAEADRAPRLLYAAPKEPAAPLTRQLRDDGFLVSEAAVYETRDALPALSAAEMARITHILVHSPKAGRAIAKVLLAHHDKLLFQNLDFVCISEVAWQAVAGALAAGGRNIAADALHHRISPFPDEASMLKLLDQSPG